MVRLFIKYGVFHQKKITFNHLKSPEISEAFPDIRKGFIFCQQNLSRQNPRFTLLYLQTSVQHVIFIDNPLALKKDRIYYVAVSTGETQWKIPHRKNQT